MKKSEMFKRAAISIIKDEDIDYEDTVYITHALMEKAILEEFYEAQEEKEAAV